MCFFEENVYESICIKAEVEAKKNALFISLYRPNTHKTLTPKEQITRFLEILSSHVEILSSHNLPIYFFTDSNLDLLDLSNGYVSDYFNILLANVMVQLITKATRIQNNSKTLLDHIVTNSSDFFLSAGVLIDYPSDHIFTFLQISENSKAPILPPQSSRCMSVNNIELFKTSLAALSWEDVTEKLDVNLAYNSFYDIFKTFFDLHFPVKKVKFNKNFHPRQPFMTQGLLQSRKTKLELAKKAKFQPSPLNSLNYKVYRNLYNKHISCAKKMYFEQKLSNCGRNSKRTLDTLKEALNLKPSKNNNIDKIEVNGQVLTSENLIANSFNKHFSSVGLKTVHNIPPSPRTPESYLHPPLPGSIFINPVTSFEIIDILSALDGKRSLDIDDIPTFLLKEVKHEIAIPLAHIANLSFETGIFPSEMKTSKTVPIFKNSDIPPLPSPLLMQNYRPIAIVKAFSKPIEQAMSIRLVTFLNSNNFFYDNQYGFLKRRSTSHAIIQSLNYIAENLNKNKSVASIFLDVSKAFDSVNFEILLKKLENAGIRGNCLQWFKSFLNDRFQKVKVGDSLSDTFEALLIGVLQGSILGAILFLVYINDLHRASDLFTVKYADDTTALTSSDCPVELATKLEGGIEQISLWFQTNKLALNISKTKLMLFPHNSQFESNMPIINISGQPLERVTDDSVPPYVKMLGFILDDKLKFKEYTNFILLKLSKGLFALSRVKNILDEKYLLMLYYTLIHSHLIYSAPVLASLTHSLKNKLFIKQKKAIRIVCGKKSNSHTLPLFTRHNILPYPVLLKFYCIKFMWQYKCNKLPVAFSDIFPTRNPAADVNYDFRNINDFFVPLVRKSRLEKLPLFNYPKLWNSLDLEFKMSDHLNDMLPDIRDSLMIKYIAENECNRPNCFICS